ncbi:MAG: metallophosphoesterase [Desulfurococcaceae archaeon]
MIRIGVYTDLFISDLHCGSIYFDILSYEKVLERLKKEEIKVLNLHLLGDLIDGKFNHQGQLYESFPIDIQIQILESSISKLIEIVEPLFIFILPGNHDRKYGINLLDIFVERLKGRYGKIEIKYFRDNLYYTDKFKLIIHGIKGLKGSDYTGFTPSLLNNLSNIAMVYNEYVRYIVSGHFHTFSMVYYHGYNMLLVPSFYYGERPLREVRGVVLLDETDGRVKPVLVSPSKREEIIDYWRSKFK